MSETAEQVTIPQPGAEPIPLQEEWGALSRYQKAEKQLRGFLKRQQEAVKPHLLASIAKTASDEMPVEEIVEAAQAFQTADDLVRLVPSAPIIYRLHCEDAVGITPEDKTKGFRLVDTNAANDYSSHWQTIIPTQRLFRLRTGPDQWEGNEGFEDDTSMKMYAALRFLVTSDEEAVDKFLHGNIGMRHVHSRVVVGQQAVNAFLKSKAKEELYDKAGEINPARFVDSWALLASGALKRLGGESPIGKHGDFVHTAGVEALADVVAVGAGYEAGITSTWRSASRDGSILRRLAGVDFNPEEDVQLVAQKATERAYSGKGNAERFGGLLYGNQAQVESHLTELAGNFVDHILGERPE